MLETASSLEIDTDMDSEEYANVEAGLPTESLDGWEEAPVEEYRESLPSSSNPQNTVADEGEETDEEDEATPPCSSREVLDCLSKVNTYFSCHHAEVLPMVDQLICIAKRKMIAEKQAALVQTTLTDSIKKT